MVMAGFTGKVALVTGGGSGIGRATALAFAREGARVVVAGRRVAEGEATVAAVRAAGGEATFVQADVTQETQVRALVERAVATYGRLDVVFNNAGTEGRFGPLVEMDEADWDATIDGNVKSVWLVMKYAIPHLVAAGGGAIINNGSNLASVGMPTAAAYTASKHAVVGLTRAAALEYAKQNIRVNSVSPGPIVTPMPERAFGSIDGFKQFMEPIIPLGRVGQPDEIAAAVLWLASDGASFMTGHDMLVDGGYVAG
jgi:NAD(P)-dependent dehydrogenase (short-subunit alcohol dehydrogenase family)